MSKKLNKIEDELDEYPPILRKVAKYYLENYHIDSFKELCDNAGVKYESARKARAKYLKKGKDFNILLELTNNRRNKALVPFLDGALFRKAMGEVSEVDVKAAKLFYQRSGALESGSGGDRNNIQVNVFTSAAPMPSGDESDTITIEVKDQEFSPQKPQDILDPE